MFSNRTPVVEVELCQKFDFKTETVRHKLTNTVEEYNKFNFKASTVRVKLTSKEQHHTAHVAQAVSEETRVQTGTHAV